MCILGPISPLLPTKTLQGASCATFQHASGQPEVTSNFAHLTGEDTEGCSRVFGVVWDGLCSSTVPHCRVSSQLILSPPRAACISVLSGKVAECGQAKRAGEAGSAQVLSPTASRPWARPHARHYEGMASAHRAPASWPQLRGPIHLSQAQDSLPGRGGDRAVPPPSDWLSGQSPASPIRLRKAPGAPFSR